MKMDVNESDTDYFSRMKNMAASVKNVGETVSKENLIAIILEGLLENFEMTVETWENEDPTKQTLDALEDRIFKVEQRIAAKEESTALMATSGREKNRTLVSSIDSHHVINRQINQTRIKVITDVIFVMVMTAYHGFPGRRNENRLDELKIPRNMEFTCKACCLGKMIGASFKGYDQERRTFQVGNFFYSDMCGAIPVDSPGSAIYYLTFIDDTSGFRKVYFLKHMSYGFECFKKFEQEVVNMFNKKIKILVRPRQGVCMC